MAALVCGLSITSCKDDDNDKTNDDPETEKTDTKGELAAMRWLCALTDTRDLTDDWASKTYDPTVGQPSTQNELNRIVVVSNLDEAKTEFASLAGIDLDGLDGVKTVSDEGVGSLTWTPSAEGAENLATVDVNSPLLPKLRQIVYCTSEQTGKNGIIFDNVKGTAYYRFGDVVQDLDGYYWVCVRPCFAPDKGDSHWFNIFNAAESGGEKKIPAKFLQTKWDNKKEYNNKPIVLPTRLPYNAWKIHDLAQLIQAMLHPEMYEQDYTESKESALGGFPAELNGRLFVEKVASFWRAKQESTGNKYSIWEMIFNTTQEKLANITEIDFYTQGYSWGLFDGNNCTLYYYRSTEHRKLYKPCDEMEFDVTAGFDVRAFAGDPDASDNVAPQMRQLYTNYNKKSYANYLVRYATGKDLAKSFLNPSPYKQLANTTDIYVYNKKTNKEPGQEQEKEKDLEEMPILPDE